MLPPRASCRRTSVRRAVERRKIEDAHLAAAGVGKPRDQRPEPFGFAVGARRDRERLERLQDLVETLPRRLDERIAAGDERNSASG